MQHNPQPESAGLAALVEVQMMENLVAHYQEGKSDKVYLACRRQALDGTFYVVAKWGRRGKELREMVKLRNASESWATVVQNKVFSEKLKEGYVDIQDPRYDGPVTPASVADYLEGSSSDCGKRMTEKDCVEELDSLGVLPDVPDVSVPEDGVAECLDNSGMEDRFDKGIEYVFESHSDPAMLWVYDKEGERTECFKDRFETGVEKR